MKLSKLIEKLKERLNDDGDGEVLVALYVGDGSPSGRPYNVVSVRQASTVRGVSTVWVDVDVFDLRPEAEKEKE